MSFRTPRFSRFAEFAPKLYPTANILVATKNDLVKEKRKRFLGRIATGKWDIVIIAQSSFNMIEDNPDLVRAKYQEELNALGPNGELCGHATFETPSEKRRNNANAASKTV